MITLTAENVDRIFMDCLFGDDEIVDFVIAGKSTKEMKVVEGVKQKIGFNAERLLTHKEEVAAMLQELPSNFQKAGGGGYSFLNLCQRADGVQWADLHQTMDQLVCLGLGLEMLEYCAPRDVWPLLPGGMPYVCVK